jgi:hypothetical protein
MNKRFPKVGDVVMNNEEKHVVIDYINNEDLNLGEYNRKYKLVPLKDMDVFMDLEKSGYWVQIIGTVFPDIKFCDDDPYEITQCTYIRARQKERVVVQEWR